MGMAIVKKGRPQLRKKDTSSSSNSTTEVILEKMACFSILKVTGVRVNKGKMKDCYHRTSCKGVYRLVAQDCIQC